jgi:hypothetical protein
MTKAIPLKLGASNTLVTSLPLSMKGPAIALGICRKTNQRKSIDPSKIPIAFSLISTAVGIPLCAKGCESSIDFFFTDFAVSGKQHDLSCFGVNFNDFVKVKVKSLNGKAAIFLNDKFCYQVDHEITKSKIIGIDFVFQGTGAVDYVRLSNNKVSFNDEF